MPANDTEDGAETESKTAIDRRKVLGALGVAATGGLAGCGGDSGGATDTEPAATPTPRVETVVKTKTVEGEEEVETVVETKTVKVTEEETPTTTEVGANLADDTFTDIGRTEFLPETLQYNPYNPKQYDFRSQKKFIGGWFGLTQFTTGETSLFNINDFTVDGTTARFHLREDGLTWHDGTEFTAEDGAFQYEFGMYNGSGPASLIGDQDPREALTVVDEFTWELELGQQIAESLVELQVLASGQATGLGADISYPPQRFSDIMEGFRDATSEEGMEEVRNELATKRVVDPLGVTPFKLSERRTNSLLLERHEDHPNPANYPYIELVWAGEQQTRMGINDVLDTSPGTNTEEQRAQLPDHWERSTRDKFGGQASWFNYRHKDVGRTRVRQAISWAVDYAKCAQVIPGPDSAMNGQHSGIGLKDPSDWLSQENMDAQWDYDVERASEMVPKLMEMEGYSQNSDGIWVDPDGEPMLVEYNAPAGHYRVDPLGRVIVESMNEFGLQAELLAVEGSNYWNKVTAGNADMNACCWGQRSSPHPIRDYRFRWRDKEAEWLAAPREFDIPEVASDPMNEPTKTINALEMIDEYPTASSERQEEIINTLSWASNWEKPRLYLSFSSAIDMFSTDHWDWPDVGSGAFQHGTPGGYCMQWEAVDDGQRLSAREQ